MKSFRTAILFTLMVVFFWMPASQGQFLKKLKKTVKELVVTPPKQGNPASAASVAASQGQPTQVNPTKRFLGSTDPNMATLKDAAAHNIQEICAITLDAKNQYIFMDYTSISLQNKQITAWIPVGTFTNSEALSELGEGSDKDQVQLYTNGIVTKTYTAGTLKKEVNLLAAHKKYDYPWSEELVRNAKKEADNYVKKGVGQGGMASIIEFNQKKYGPYLLVGDLVVSKDRQRFFAQISPDLKATEKGIYYILGMDGQTRQLPTGGDLIANREFTSGAVLIASATISLNASLHNNSEGADGSETSQSAAVMQMQTEPNKGNVYFLNGKTLENVLISGGWLDQSGQNFFATTAEKNSGFEKGTYLNGKKIYDQAIKVSRGWTTPLGTSWALEVDDYKLDGMDQLIFSDGTRIYEARDVHELVIDDKYYMVWYNYNQKYSNQLKVYKKAL